MKAVSNTKEFYCDHWYYRMLRIINGMQYGYNVCITEIEMQEYRPFVARRLWDARRELRNYIEELEFERCGLT